MTSGGASADRWGLLDQPPLIFVIYNLKSLNVLKKITQNHHEKLYSKYGVLCTIPLFDVPATPPKMTLEST